MPQFVLARHVFVCMQGEHVVFLDVRKDRYFALEAVRTAGLGQFVAGWPVPSPPVGGFAQHSADSTVVVISEQADRGALSAVISLLLDRGLLTTEMSDGKNAAPVVVEPLRGDVTVEALDERPRIGLGMFWRFVSAAIRARLLLKYRTLEAVVARVHDRADHSQPIPAMPSDDRLSQLVYAFGALRPFFFTAKDACLFDALALSEFLASYRLFPHWVFGVQARPFAAHCWLQLDGLVLNDTVEHVKRYTPIMVV